MPCNHDKSIVISLNNYIDRANTIKDIYLLVHYSFVLESKLLFIINNNQVIVCLHNLLFNAY